MRFEIRPRGDASVTSKNGERYMRPTDFPRIRAAVRSLNALRLATAAKPRHDRVLRGLKARKRSLKARHSKACPMDWIANPKPEVRVVDGRIESVFLRLRPAPPLYTVQPNSECQVFLHLAADHWPMAIEILPGSA